MGFLSDNYLQYNMSGYSDKPRCCPLSNEEYRQYRQQCSEKARQKSLTSDDYLSWFTDDEDEYVQYDRKMKRGY